MKSILITLKQFVTSVVKNSLYYFSGFSIRDKNLWVFGSYGVYNDNSRYLFEYVSKNTNVNAVWISTNRDSLKLARDYGGVAYYKYSLKGIYTCLRASAYIYSNYVSSINYFTCRNASLVNLWHGIALKKIEFDIDSGVLLKKFSGATWLDKFTAPELHVKQFVLSPSQYVYESQFKSAFRIDEKSVLFGVYPRIVDLINVEPYLEFKDKFNFVYVPTWRDGGEDFLSKSKIDFEFLDKQLDKIQCRLLIKLHSNSSIELPFASENIRIIDNKIDSNKLLKSADCLITDYSSIFFDFLHLQKPIIFFPFDIQEYSKNRGFYYNYEDLVPGPIAYNFEQLVDLIMLTHTKTDTYRTIRLEALKRFWGNEIEYDNANLFNKIISKLK